MSDEIPVESDLQAVKEWLLSIPNFEKRVGNSIRKSLDEVIDGARTGRWSITDLEKTEKTYIGTKIEIVLRAELCLERGDKLDTKICGKEVDIKWSLTAAWMIPTECVGEICLLVTADDQRSRFSVGLITATKECLNTGTNKDDKATISKEGKKTIVWLVQNGELPENFLLHLPPDVRERILSCNSGQARVVSLFREVQNRIIPREVVQTLAQQDDSMKRVRDARKWLEEENILILGGQELSHKMLTEMHGLPLLQKGESLSFRIAPEPLLPEASFASDPKETYK